MLYLTSFTIAGSSDTMVYTRQDSSRKDCITTITESNCKLDAFTINSLVEQLEQRLELSKEIVATRRIASNVVLTILKR